MHDEIDFLPNRLNYDAIVFKGCNANELKVIAASCLLLCCVICALLLSMIADNAIYGVALGLMLGFGMTYVTCSILETVRAGQEAGYLQQLIALNCYHWGISRSPVIRRSGYWMIGRGLR